jgi:hypothetical protein
VLVGVSPIVHPVSDTVVKIVAAAIAVAVISEFVIINFSSKL